MNVAPIRARRDYRRVLAEIEGLMRAKRGTPEGDRLDVLVTLVEAWEAKHYPIDLPDPVAAIKYHMEHKGLEPRDLIPYIGKYAHFNEVYQGLEGPLDCDYWVLAGNEAKAREQFKQVPMML